MISARKIVRYTAGITLVLIGLLALLTPLTPGSWLIFVGLELLGLRILLRDKLLAWARARPNSRWAGLIRRLVRFRKQNPDAEKKLQEACRP